MQNPPSRGAPPALRTYIRIVETGDRPSVAVVVAALKACSISQDIESGKKIHSIEARFGERSLDVRVASTLIDMYSKCGNLVEATRVFQSVRERRSIVLWNCIIKACAENQNGELGLELFSQLREEARIPANFVTYLAALRACIALADKEKKTLVGAQLVKAQSLKRGRDLHAQAAASGDDTHIFVANSLVDMYAKCGSLSDARRVFDRITQRTVVSWTAMIQGYAELGHGELALDLFDEMQSSECYPNNVTFVAALKACVNVLVTRKDQMENQQEKIRDVLRKGRSIHSQALKHGHGNHPFVASSLVEMYARCGSMEEANGVFEKIMTPDLVSWTGMISGYAQKGDTGRTIEFFSRMLDKGIQADTITFSAVLHALAEANNEVAKVQHGKQVVLARVVRNGIESNIVMGNCVLDFYAKCGDMLGAQQVFDCMVDKDTVSWNCLIAGYGECKEGKMGLKIFEMMRNEGWKPDAITYLAVLKACVSLAESLSKEHEKDHELSSKLKECHKLETDKLQSKVREIHREAWKDGLECNVFVASRLVETYAKFGDMEDSRKVFENMRQRDLVSWNCMITGYAECGQEEMALKLYYRMRDEEGIPPNPVTILAALKACAALYANQSLVDKNMCLEKAGEFHLDARRYGLEEHVFVASSLVDTYVKCGSLANACQVFEKISNPNVVAWTSIIRGYAEGGDAEKALDLYSRMRASGVSSDATTFTAVLKACGNYGALETGRKIEAEVRNAGLHKNLMVVNSIIDFYGKCGSIAEAEERFSLVGDEEKDLITWNSMLDGYSRQGDAASAFNLLKSLEEQELLEPNEITFLSVLSACNHAGLVTEGKSYFERMVTLYGLKPSIKHYGVMVDLLGQANKLEEALAMVLELGDRENVVPLWICLLDACCKWKNDAIGKTCFQTLQRLEGLGVVDTSSGSYVLMSNYICSRQR
ncbi:pentatricopeptide repeat-containing protein At3g09040, mitochondrial-like [Selaginella moellendorffii]|uniref:pentatricopeptide repeat-containing protein At3g09040, mitochondrial-like n=1 Tax=Selaginella moellendorffii TaxID=88036 RepID=UPI000D1CAA62|nr:pentatricopeptide repeat-containing protein At3g09040, mitochondrial-like [Selaginella moellendorffii]|eukprot:XP_024543788.1 pentatricopeptide repeat-containing protein At3g09040, mitochondrial-like [Selaginella moellendorffii]